MDERFVCVGQEYDASEAQIHLSFVCLHPFHISDAVQPNHFIDSKSWSFCLVVEQDDINKQTR